LIKKIIAFQIIGIIISITTLPVFAHDFRIFCHVGPKPLFPAKTYRKMGIDAVWFNCGLPVKLSRGTKAEWISEEDREKTERIFKHFEGSGIRVFPLTSIFYESHPDKSQINRWIAKPHYRCFSSDVEDVICRLRFFIEELSKYKSFGGICLDDEPGIQAGGCVCERCRELFKKNYGIDVPAKTDFWDTAEGIVAETHPVLLWTHFQEKLIRSFYANLAAAIKEQAHHLEVLTIPAAAYFSGKQFSIPNCEPEKFVKSRRNVTLDKCHLQDYQLYVQFYMNRVRSSPSPDGWPEKVADGLCLIMTDSGVRRPNIPIFSASAERPNEKKTISVSALKRFIIQTFAEGANGIVYFPEQALTCEHVNAATETFEHFIKPLCNRLPALHRVKGKAAVLYSTTTRAFADIWRNNPIERYKHVHQCDAISYALFRKGIPFDVILEDELKSPKELEHFKIVISAGINYLTKGSADILTTYLNKGGRVVFDKTSKVKIPGAEFHEFNAEYWFRAVSQGVQRPADLEFQAGILDNVLSKLLDDNLSICRPTSRRLNINYLTDGLDMYLFIVNDDLNTNVRSNLRFNQKYSVEDFTAQKDSGVQNSVFVSIEPAGLKILRLTSF